MANFNKVILMGNVTRDPENRGRDSVVCAFGLAVNRQWRNNNGEKQEEVCFVDCTAFGGRDKRKGPGDIILEYVRKGDPLFVEGRLKMEEWDDRESGKKRSRLVVIVEAVQLMGSKRDDGGGGDRGGRDDDRGARSGDGRDSKQGQSSQGGGGGGEVDFSDIPF